MPESDTDSAGGIDAVAGHLYALRPDEFVPARDDAARQAREDGDRDLARAIARLRRPTKAAWLANLLAQQRSEQLDALLTLAVDLADAQRTLDGGALRALSSQRNRLVAAMAREAGRLAYEAGDSAAESVVRDLQGILEAALADPAVAEEVRSGRLTRTVSYSGFGPVTDPDTAPPPVRRPVPVPAAAPPGDGTRGGTRGESDSDTDGDTGSHTDGDAAADRERAAQEKAAREQAARERAAKERAERERALAAAEQEEAAARERQEADDDAREDAEAAHTAARERVADLAAELEAARQQERAAAAAARAAAAAAKESARAAGAAATRAARARARLDDPYPG